MTQLQFSVGHLFCLESGLRRFFSLHPKVSSCPSLLPRAGRCARKGEGRGLLLRKIGARTHQDRRSHPAPYPLSPLFSNTPRRRALLVQDGGSLSLEGVGGRKTGTYPTHSWFRRAILRRGLRQKKSSLVSSSPLDICAAFSPDLRMSQ